MPNLKEEVTPYVNTAFRERLQRFREMYAASTISTFEERRRIVLQNPIQSVPYGMLHDLEQFLPPGSLTYSIRGVPVQRFPIIIDSHHFSNDNSIDPPRIIPVQNRIS
jgi:hypothetical protein